jgi:hypothetical protein
METQNLKMILNKQIKMIVATKAIIILIVLIMILEALVMKGMIRRNRRQKTPIRRMNMKMLLLRQQMSHQIHLMMRILMNTRIPTRILRILLKTILSSDSRIPGTIQVLSHPKPMTRIAQLIKAIRKVLTTLILTLMITPDHMETKGDTRTPQVGKNRLGFAPNKPMGLG